MNMRTILAAAGAVAALAFAQSAGAVTYVSTTLNSGNAITVPPGFTAGPSVMFTTSDTDIGLFEFKLGSAMTISDATFTQSGGAGIIALNTITLYSGYGVGGSVIADPTSFALPVGFAKLGEITLAAGMYTIAVGGPTTTTTPSTPATIGSSFSFTAAAVPEPATWGMMIVGLGMVGSTLRTRARKSALLTA